MNPWYLLPILGAAASFAFMANTSGYVEGYVRGYEIGAERAIEEAGQCQARNLTLQQCALKNGWDMKNG